MSKKPARIDKGLAEIDAWGAWFISAHTARLKALSLPADQHERELAAVTELAGAVTRRLRDDYLARMTR